MQLELQGSKPTTHNFMRLTGLWHTSQLCFYCQVSDLAMQRLAASVTYRKTILGVFAVYMFLQLCG